MKINRRVTTTARAAAGAVERLSVPYKVYPELDVINPWSVKTQEDEVNYYKSLLYGCRECDRIEASIEFMLCHKCTKNGKSKYEQHQQEALKRKLKLISKKEMERKKVKNQKMGKTNLKKAQLEWRRKNKK